VGAEVGGVNTFTRSPDTVQRAAVRHRSGVVTNSAPENSEFITIPGLQRTTTCCAAPGKCVVDNMKARFFVYILANRPRGVLYVGVTNNLPRRIWEHKTKIVSGFTRTYGVINLVYYEGHASILEARERERAVKRWRRAWKFQLIEELNPDWRDLADELVLL
jgi:putative endonuclease